MKNNTESTSISETAKWALEIQKKSAEWVKKMNETTTICYIDNEGYLVEKTPNGVITRKKGIKKLEPRKRND